MKWLRCQGWLPLAALATIAAHCGHGKSIISRFPDAATAETARLAFHASSTSSTGPLDDQTRAALDDLLRKGAGARIVRLRVFAVGQEHLIQVRAMLARLLLARRTPLPPLSLLGVASLPGPGQLVQMESVVETLQPVDTRGVAFLAGLATPSGDRTMGGLARVARSAGIAPQNVLRVSCFYEAAGQYDLIKQAVADTFPTAEASFAQSYASALSPAVECEAVARLTDSLAEAVRYFNLPGTPPSPNFSRASLVTARRVVLTGTLVAQGTSEGDVRVALDSAERSVKRLGGDLHDVVMAGNYWLTATARDSLRVVRQRYYGSTVPAATGIFLTNLGTASGTVGMELAIAVDK
jgi:hypothetical protein